MCWLVEDIDVFLMDELICGIDVGVCSEIYSFFYGFVELGCIVIVVLSDFVEVIGVVDCVFVMK